jgi:hypothetical protein
MPATSITSWRLLADSSNLLTVIAWYAATIGCYFPWLLFYHDPSDISSPIGTLAKTMKQI